MTLEDKVVGRIPLPSVPRVNEGINEEWLSDVSRYAVDGVQARRLDKPWVRGADGRLAPATWDQALEAVAERVKAAAPERTLSSSGLAASTGTGNARRHWCSSSPPTPRRPSTPKT